MPEHTEKRNPTLIVRIAPRVYVHGPDATLADLPLSSLVLAQIPGAVFGDGSHPTTQLSAQAVDYLCRMHTIQSMLDVGTGTGVLARVARARGVRFIAATDIDPAALAIAQKNAALDNHPKDIIFTNQPPDFMGATFDLVVANILEKTLQDHAPVLCRALSSDSALCISGFTPFQAPGLKCAFKKQGVTFAQEYRLDEWSLLMFYSKKR